MLRSLRRAIAVSGLATGLVLVPVAVPLAAAQTPPLPPPAAPCGSLGPPICGLIDQFEQALAPLQPVFALGIPLVTELGNSLHELQATLEQLATGTPLDDVQGIAGQVGDLVAVIGGVTKPILAPLNGLGLGGLLSVLTELQYALAGQGAPGPSAAASPSTPVSVPGSVVLPSASVGGRSLAPSIPAVPEGQALELPDLALPDFGATVADAVELAAAATPDLPAPSVPDPLDTTNDAAAAGVAVALAGVLLTAGVLATRARSARRAVD